MVLWRATFWYLKKLYVLDVDFLDYLYFDDFFVVFTK